MYPYNPENGISQPGDDLKNPAFKPGFENIKF
jgi:hypothetical protein